MPIASNQVNAVALAVLPQSPLDPATGLQVPTIAVATSGGITVLKDDGTAVNSSLTGSFAHVSLTPKYMLADATSAAGMYFTALPIAATGFSQGLYGVSEVIGSGTDAVATSCWVGSNQFARASNAAGRGIRLTRHNPSSIAAGLTTNITGTYSTGWMVGDIRRSLAADTYQGATIPNVVTNGDFAANVTGWSAANGTSGSASVTWSSGTMQVSGTVQNDRGEQGLTLIPGVAYEAFVTVTALTAPAFNFSIIRNTAGGFAAISSLGSGSAVGTYKLTFVAPASDAIVQCAIWGGAGSVNFDNVIVRMAVADRSVKAKNSSINGTLAMTAVASAAQLVAYSGFSATNYIQEAYSADLDYGTAAWQAEAWVNYTTAAVSTILDRSAAAGAFWTLGTDATGKLTATANDGSTARTVTASVATNDSTWHHVRVTYSAAGALTLFLDGVQNAQTTGTALLTLNNAAAVFTLGNNRALSAAFPGSIALVRTGATVPFAEQIAFAYAQERAMFQPGVQVALPDTGAVLGLTYDDMTDQLVAATAANEATFTGLVRTATAPAAAGAILMPAARSGWKLMARQTTNPGVDVTMPSLNLREQLLRRAEDAARTPRVLPPVDFDATTSQTDFVLMPGVEAQSVKAAGTDKREGASKDWQRKFDGFKETVSFNTGQSSGTWVQVIPRRAA